MTTREQVKPLAPSSYQFSSDEDEAMSKQFKLSRRGYIQFCGCLTALLLIAMVIIIVIATVSHVKNPIIRMNSVTILNIQPVKLFSNGTIHTGQNITLLADVSLKNPNMASFRYSNTTTTIYYGGKIVGESKIPAGLAKARRTIRMNMTVDIIPENIWAVPSLTSDILSSKALNMSSYTKIAGRVKILNIFKKSILVKMNCTITYNISTSHVQQNCWRRC